MIWGLAASGNGDGFVIDVFDRYDGRAFFSGQNEPPMRTITVALVPDTRAMGIHYGGYLAADHPFNVVLQKPRVRS